MKQNQRGFGVVEILIIVVVLVLIGGIGYYVLSKNSDSSGSEQAATNTATIKHLGINLDYFDPETEMAGDLKFTMFQFQKGGFDKIFLEYGEEDPINDAQVVAGKNPQPTFLAPLGTKVYAIADGQVVNVPKLYSNDYSVHVQPEGSDLIFENEHVINVRVKVGDMVKAGDWIAEVSDYDGDKLGGLGVLEIGVLLPGNPPKHACTFDYLDDSIKDETFKKLTALKKAWEDYRGEPNAYDESKVVVPGCLTRDPIEG